MKRALLASALLCGSVISASAITLEPVAADCDPSVPNAFPDSVLCGSGDRQLVSNINLGDPDGKFYSLGLDESGSEIGGGLVLRVDPAFTGSTMVFEVTGAVTHKEAAEVYAATYYNDILDNDLVLVGTVDNGGGDLSMANQTLTISGEYNYIGFLDASIAVYGASTQTEDGFDIDSIKLTPVPIPAPIALLGASLLGLIAVRRKV